MSTPSTERQCVECSRLEVPSRCDVCRDSFLVSNVLMPNVQLDRPRTLEDLAEIVFQKLTHQGYCVVDKFHRENNAVAILDEVKRIHKDGLMHNGQLTSSVPSANIRGDQIAWIDSNEEHVQKTYQNICSHMKKVDMLVRFLNMKITHKTLSDRTQAMVACYPGEGRRYVKHVDNPKQDGRCITTLYYLNKDYDASVDGGILRLYPGAGEAHINIEPLLDRLLIFWSDQRNPHEVLPAFSTRYAITLWYFDRDEREAEKQRLYMRELRSQTEENDEKQKGSQQNND